MKTLLALAGLCLALNSHALTLRIYFEQNNWDVDLDFVPYYDTGVPVPFAYYSGGMYLNGTLTAFGEANGFHQALNEPMDPFVVGLNTIRVVLSTTGEEVTGTFTIAQPTGPRVTHKVPDSGSTIALLGVVAGLLIGLRRVASVSGHGLSPMAASSM